MDDEIEQSEFELDDDDSPYWDFDDQYWDDQDDHDYHDDEDEEYHYWCDICSAEDEDPCNEFIHDLHDKAQAALDPQLDYWPCGKCGGVPKFQRRSNADEFVSEEYAVALCSGCYQSYTVLHTPDTKRILAVYPGYRWFYRGDLEDQPDTWVESYEDLPF